MLPGRIYVYRLDARVIEAIIGFAPLEAIHDHPGRVARDEDRCRSLQLLSTA